MARRHWPAWANLPDILDLLRLATPVAISRAAMMLMALTDAIVLGLNATGELPYVLNAWLPIGIALGGSWGLLMGVQVITAELSGKGDDQNSGRVFRRGLYFAIIIGALATLLIVPTADSLFTLIKLEAEHAAATAAVTRILAYGLIGHFVTTVCSMYLEALRKPLIVTVIMYGGVLINIVIDLAFVAGWWGMPQMGAEGVAIATTGTRWLMVVAFLIAVWLMTPAWKPSTDAPADEAQRQYSVGAGTAISNMAEWGGFNFTYVIASWIALEVTTVYGLAVHVMGVAFMLFLGIGTATSVRVAEKYGVGDMAGARDASFLGIVTTIVSGTVLGLLVVIGQDIIPTLMLDGEEGTALRPLLASIMLLTAFALVFDGLQNVASMALRAQGVIWLPTIVQFGAYLMVLLASAYYLGYELNRGAQGMMEGVIIASVFAGIGQLYLVITKTARHSREPRAA